MKRSILASVLVVCCMIVIAGIAALGSASAASSASGPTSTKSSTTTTIKTKPPLVFGGHSPVDMEVCYSPSTSTGLNACTSPSSIKIGPIKQKTIIGCLNNQCTLFNLKNIVYLATFSLSPLSIATFTGPTGTGCDTEETLYPETITITNPPPGTYTLQLFPSDTFFATNGPGCHHHTTTTTTVASFPYTITITDVNTITMTGTTGQNSPTSSFSGSLSPTGVVSFSSFIPTPVFPVGAIVAIVVPLLALVTYIVVSDLMSRKRGILPAL